MSDVFQSSLPYDPIDRNLPGIQPMPVGSWLHCDDAFAGQMALRDQLLAEKRADVLVLDETARPAAEELLQSVLEDAYPGAVSEVQRPDGAIIPIDRSDPLGTLCRIVQEDFAILQKQGDEHVLTGAILCFPASWTLSEKFMRPLTDIHIPVKSYDANIARRVQRLFDGVRVGHPMWRYNVLWYDSAQLHRPRPQGVPRIRPAQDQAKYLRSERQCILRLPQSQAVVFSIHTYLLQAQDVPKSFGAASDHKG